MKISPAMKEELRKFLLKKMREEDETIHVTSAHKLSSEEIEQIKSKIGGLKDQKIITLVDESLMAGIIIKKGSKIVDLSLKGKLDELEQMTYEIA